MEVIHPTWPPLAPLFHYYVTKNDNNGANQDGFLSMDSAINTLTNQGICQRDLFIHYRTYLKVPRKHPLWKHTRTVSTDGYCTGANHFSYTGRTEEHRVSNGSENNCGRTAQWT
jgi:hypothetical protein